MKKIFTLIIAAGLAMTVSAQDKFGLYTDRNDEEKLIYAVEYPAESGDYGFGIYTANNVAVARAQGSTCVYYPDIKDAYPKTQYFNSATTGGNLRFDADIYGFDDELLYSTTADGSGDKQSQSRWGDDAPGGEVKQASDLVKIAPEWWAGFSVDIPEGQTLNVNKISIGLGAQNNFIWCVNVCNAEGETVYQSGNAKMGNSNSFTQGVEYQTATSADITSDRVIETNGWGPKNNIPLSDYKDAGSPVNAFAMLPEDGLNLTGKNTVRLYFGVKNARLIGIEHFWLEGTVAGADGISSVTAAPAAAARAYNLAGQAVGSDYKGVVIKGGKKVVQ